MLISNKFYVIALGRQSICESLSGLFDVSFHYPLFRLPYFDQGVGYGPKGRGCCGKEWEKGMVITEFLILGRSTGTRYELNSQSHTQPYEREKKVGEAEKWRMEGHGKQTAYVLKE